MQNSKTAGQTAKRTLVIFRDCHKKNNIVIDIESRYEERFYRNFARRMGWLCTFRKDTVQPVVQPVETALHNWCKPVAIKERPRTQLGGAFCLNLYPMAKEGGAV